MKFFLRNPALLLACAFGCGIIVTNVLTLPLKWILAALGVILLVVSILIAINRRTLSTLMLIILFAVLGMGLTRLKLHTWEHNPVHYLVDLPCTVAVEGVIDKPVNTTGDQMRTVIATDSIWVGDSVFAIKCRLLLRLFEPVEEFAYGDRIVVRGQLRAATGVRNPGEFNYRHYLRAQNIHAILSANSAPHLLILNHGEGSILMREFVCPARRFILAFIRSTMEGKPAALLQALLVGAKGDLDNELRESFADVGVIHVLAVSGLHVGFIMIGLLGMFSFVRLPEPWRTVMTVLGLLFYALLTGLVPSVFRATIMAIVMLLGMLLQRKSRGLNSLAVAALVVLIVQPLDLFQPGFQLSFSAVAGILLIYQKLANLFSGLFATLYDKGFLFLINILQLLFVSLAAQLATLPLTLYYFGKLPLLGLLANLVVVPAVGLIVSTGFIAVITAAIWFPIGAAFANSAWLFLTLLIRFVRAVSQLPFACMDMTQPNMWLLAIYILLLLLFIGWHSRAQRRAIFICLLLLLNAYAWMHLSPDQRGLHITFLDVGQGDATFLEFPDGKTMLVDAGDRTDYVDCGDRVILPFLKRKGVKQIDCLLLTHEHADHIGGAISLVEKMPIGRLVLSPFPYASEFGRKIDSLARVHAIRRQKVASGDTLLLDPHVLVLVLHPDRFDKRADERKVNINDLSIVLKCIYSGKSVLLTGDAEKPSETAMARYGELLKSDVLKLAHHGSATAGSAEFRMLVSPRYGIVSVAKFNRFNLPSDSLLAEYEKSGTRILQTAHNGAIQLFISDEGKIQIY